jgi:hypothetical protein
VDAVIVSKTRMHNGICVGAILGDGRCIRLLDENGHNQPLNSVYEIGEIWDLRFRNRPDTTEPHNEDVLVIAAEFKDLERPNLHNYLINDVRANVWRGSPNNLFDEKISWTGAGSGYISQRTGLPDQSVGFYISDRDLTYNNHHYIYPRRNLIFGEKKLAYVGHQEPTPVIPAGTLIRVSLARWWKPDDIEIELRCYAQLSGWYTR